jgi:hypothetical protein
MKDTRVIELLAQIFAKTQSGKLAWEPTAQEGIFVVPLKGKYTLKAFPSTDYLSTPEGSGPPSFTLYEGNEMLLDATYKIEGVPEQGLRELYEMVRRRALRVDKKLDDILSDLKNL